MTGSLARLAHAAASGEQREFRLAILERAPEHFQFVLAVDQRGGTAIARTCMCRYLAS